MCSGNELTIDYRVLEELSSTDFTALEHLYRLVEWLGPEESGAFLFQAVKGSEAVIAAYAEDRLVGFGRAISDGLSDAYLQDIVVDPEFRHHGIGGEIVNRLAELLTERGIDWIGLVGEPGTESFYRNLGLTPQPAYTFFLFPKKAK